MTNGHNSGADNPLIAAHNRLPTACHRSPSVGHPCAIRAPSLPSIVGDRGPCSRPPGGRQTGDRRTNRHVPPT